MSFTNDGAVIRIAAHITEREKLYPQSAPADAIPKSRLRKVN
jgi:hypothetical protein